MKKDNFKASVAYHCKIFIKSISKVNQKVYRRSIRLYCKHFETVLYYENFNAFVTDTNFICCIMYLLYLMSNAICWWNYLLIPMHCTIYWRNYLLIPIHHTPSLGIISKCWTFLVNLSKKTTFFLLDNRICRYHLIG